MPNETDSLVERLRAYRPTNEWGDCIHHVICDEAADALDSLDAENADLRTTLDNVRKMYAAAEKREAANARLVAPAPEIMDALQACHEVMHQCTAVLSANDCATVAAVMAQVRAAIAKATSGECPHCDDGRVYADSSEASWPCPHCRPEADSGMSGSAVARAEWVWANLPTGNLAWTGLTTAQKALVCHILAQVGFAAPKVLETFAAVRRILNGIAEHPNGDEDDRLAALIAIRLIDAATAQAIDARSGQTACGLDPKGESAVANGDAPR